VTKEAAGPGPAVFFVLGIRLSEVTGKMPISGGLLKDGSVHKPSRQFRYRSHVAAHLSGNGQDADPIRIQRVI
jgi:hypothetical protein